MQPVAPIQIKSPAGDYQPGVCNIGPAEIARRQRAGHAGAIASVVVVGALVAVGAPPITRLVVAVPATLAASGYLQARARFCVGFASKGVWNFGALGQTHAVTDDDARARDRATARRISLTSLGIGVAVGIVAALLPI